MNPASTPTRAYVMALGTTVATALALVLGAGALGIIGEGGRPDRFYLSVLVVLVLGSAAARLRRREMAFVLVATALTQVLVTTGALAAGLHRDAGGSVFDIIWINAIYASLFGLAAWLFRRASLQQQAAA